MSTNFYGEILSDDGLFWERYHLGQSSIGWEFLFRADSRRGVTGIRRWLGQLGAFDRIVNEYGDIWLLDDFLEYVEARRVGKSRMGYGPVYRDQDCAFLDEGFC